MLAILYFGAYSRLKLPASVPPAHTGYGLLFHYYRIR